VETAGLVGSEEIYGLLEEGLIPILDVDGVAGGKGVAGIHAKTKVAFAIGPFDDGCQLLQLVTDEGALTGSVLEQDPGSAFRSSGVHFVEGLGDAIDPFLFSSAEVGSGMYDEPRYPEPVAAIQLITQRRTRAPEVVRIGRCEIYQIGGVGHESRDLAIAELLHEALHIGLSERLSLPLTSVLDEDLNGITGQIGASRDGPKDTASDGNMGTE